MGWIIGIAAGAVVLAIAARAAIGLLAEVETLIEEARGDEPASAPRIAASASSAVARP